VDAIVSSAIPATTDADMAGRLFVGKSSSTGVIHDDAP
jgi:hypothetical protein